MTAVRRGRPPVRLRGHGADVPALQLLRRVLDRRQHRERWVGAMQRTAVPLRLIDGPQDPISGAHMVARYRELIPQPDTVELPGIGHYPQVEAPEQVLQHYLAFRQQRAP